MHLFSFPIASLYLFSLFALQHARWSFIYPSLAYFQAGFYLYSSMYISL